MEPEKTTPQPEHSAESDAGTEWRHCRWFDPHPPTPVPGSVVENVRATGLPGATCATCGEALTVCVTPPGKGRE